MWSSLASLRLRQRHGALAVVGAGADAARVQPEGVEVVRDVVVELHLARVRLGLVVLARAHWRHSAPPEPAAAAARPSATGSPTSCPAMAIRSRSEPSKSRRPSTQVFADGRSARWRGARRAQPVAQRHRGPFGPGADRPAIHGQRQRQAGKPAFQDGVGADAQSLLAHATLARAPRSRAVRRLNPRMPQRAPGVPPQARQRSGTTARRRLRREARRTRRARAPARTTSPSIRRSRSAAGSGAAPPSPRLRRSRAGRARGQSLTIMSTMLAPWRRPAGR